MEILHVDEVSIGWWKASDNIGDKYGIGVYLTSSNEIIVKFAVLINIVAYLRGLSELKILYFFLKDNLLLFRGDAVDLFEVDANIIWGVNILNFGGNRGDNRLIQETASNLKMFVKVFPLLVGNLL